MPRALTRDEQAILNHVRRGAASVPVPELAARLGIAPEAVQTACEYLVSRSLLRASIYAVAPITPTKQNAAAPLEPALPA